jgi:hypothetical protein
MEQAAEAVLGPLAKTAQALMVALVALVAQLALAACPRIMAAAAVAVFTQTLQILSRGKAV